MSDNVDNDSASLERSVLSRPTGHLGLIPYEFRWEAVRRHPYYLLFWEEARRYYQAAASDESGYVAKLMVGAAGVHAVPVDPNSTHADLEMQDINPAFRSGSLFPLTYRAMLIMLVQQLPADERLIAGSILQASGSDLHRIEGDDEAQSLQRFMAVHFLTECPSKTLDSFPDAPLYSLQLAASQRTLIRDLTMIMNEWKQRNNIPERRVRDDKFPQYFKVWDLREGWKDGCYSRQYEKKLIDIGRELRMNISSVRNAYSSAFEIITGHEFSPERWWRVFGRPKCSEVYGDSAQALSAPMRRRIRAAIPRPVPESRLPPPETSDGDDSRVGFVEHSSTEEDDFELCDMLLDLPDLIERGLSDEEIAQRLDLKDVGLVGAMRESLRELKAIDLR